MPYQLVDGAAVWRLSATHGLPLELALSLLADDGRIPTWDRLLDAAAADGAHIPRLGRRLQDVISDAYAPEDAAEIRRRLTLLLTRYPN